MLLLMILLLFLLLGTLLLLRTTCSVSSALLPIFALILASVNSGIKEILMVTISFWLWSIYFLLLPFLLGSPIDVGVPYDASFSSTDKAVLLRAQRIAKLPLPYVVSYRLFTSLVSSCYNHFALSCDLSASQNASLKHAITAILVP